MEKQLRSKFENVTEKLSKRRAYDGRDEREEQRKKIETKSEKSASKAAAPSSCKASCVACFTAGRRRLKVAERLQASHGDTAIAGATCARVFPDPSEGW